MQKRLLVCCLIYFFMYGLLFSQDNTGQTGTVDQNQQQGQTQPSQVQPLPAKPVPVPEEYKKDEFPQWLLDTRRAEIILIGSIPLTFFLVTEFYDLYRFINYGVTANLWDTRYAPWPLTAQEKAPYDPDGEKLILISALVSAVLVATTDYIIGKITGRKLSAADK